MDLGPSVELDPTVKSIEAIELENSMKGLVIGQDACVEQVTDLLQVFQAGFSPNNRPISNILLLGPTGVGKTRLVEALCLSLFGMEKACLKIDCAEFQHSHETAKLVGSPPGYLGHKTTEPLITQEKLDRHHTKNLKLSVVLFDEIEKANEAFWQLLLGVLDKATLTLGDGAEVNFSRSIIFMTSNLGAMQMQNLITGSLGFASSPELAEYDLQSKLKSAATSAATKNFRPEFMNRLDKTIVFNNLTRETLKKILRIELGMIQKRILSSPQHQKFVFSVAPAAEELLLDEGTSLRYGARELKRTLEKRLVVPLSHMVASGQVTLGDVVKLEVKDSQLKFSKIPGEVIASRPEDEWERFQPSLGVY